MHTSQKILWLSGWAFQEDSLRRASVEGGLEQQSLFVSSVQYFQGVGTEFSKGPSQAALQLTNFLKLHPEIDCIVGWSLGATLAIEAVSLLEGMGQGRPKGLLLIAGRAYFPTDELGGVMTPERRAELILFREAFDKEPLRQMLRFYRLCGSRRPGLKQQAQDILDRYGKETCRSALLYLEEKDNRAALVRLATPVVFLSGKLDKVIPENRNESFDSQGRPGEGVLSNRARFELQNAEHNLPETHFREIGLLARMFFGVSGRREF